MVLLNIGELKKALAKVGTLYMRVSTLTSTMIQQRELKN